jgi:peptidoglycan/xylan/chitin deacetylase (PgdA/CDA1 family)
MCELPPIHQYLAEKRPYFDWNGMQQWVKAGHSIGFHTHTHPFCSRLSPDQIETEVAQPATELKNRLGVDDVCFSYPFGDRFAPAMEHELFRRGLFKALFGTKGFVTRGTSNARFERLGLEGLSVEKQLRSERLGAWRRDVKEHWGLSPFIANRSRN